MLYYSGFSFYNIYRCFVLLFVYLSYICTTYVPQPKTEIICTTFRCILSPKWTMVEYNKISVLD